MRPKQPYSAALRAATVTGTVRERVLESGDAYWTLSAFRGLPASAVSQALSRLAREGTLKRLRKGLYYRPRPTIVGESLPSAAAVASRVLGDGARPTGLTAANLLGLTTQNPARATYVVPRANPPTGLREMTVTARRAPQSKHLGAKEAALLEALRVRACTSDLDPEQTVRRLGAVLKDPPAFRRIAEAAAYEPPRVRAMLGALGQEMGIDSPKISALRASLNPLSRFDFGMLRVLRHAREWQAK